MNLLKEFKKLRNTVSLIRIRMNNGSFGVDGISEFTSGAGILLMNAIIRKLKLVSKDATGSVSALELAAGAITSTSAAAVSLTLPTATLLANQIRGERGVFFDFVIDNSAGANIVTLVVNTGIVAAAAVLTGGATLTVAAGSVGQFRIYFTGSTSALLYRLA